MRVASITVRFNELRWLGEARIKWIYIVGLGARLIFLHES